MAMGQGEKQHEQRKEHKHVLNILTLLPKVQIEDAFFFFKWWKEGSKFTYKYSMSVRYQGLLYLGAGSWTYLMFSFDIAK